MFETKRYMHCLFWAHLVLEKLAKALWVRNNEENIPPKIHNLITLLNQANVDLGHDKMRFLHDYNAFQLSARYPDYVSNIYKVCTKPFAEEQMKQVKEIRKCLLEVLP
jgi:HEPN domain-containing protein